MQLDVYRSPPANIVTLSLTLIHVSLYIESTQLTKFYDPKCNGS